MSDKTGISWTDATWNPVRGCSRISEGCRNCYAERMAGRFSGPGMPYEGLATIRKGVNFTARWTGEVRLVAEHLADPLRWRKPRRIFVNSMSDLFHEGLTNEQIAAVFGVMAAAPQHTFQILTKRARRMREWFAWAGRLTLDDLEAEAKLQAGEDRDYVAVRGHTWPLPNVWLGVSVEDQAAADARIPELLATPAAVRFLSCEPLIGAVTLQGDKPAPAMRSRMYLRGNGGDARIDWVIAGCESGPGARPCSVEWLRSLRDQCAAAGVAYFLKQAVFTSGVYVGAATLAIGADDGSKLKAGGVIELPYLDGVQHKEMPNADR